MYFESGIALNTRQRKVGFISTLSLLDLALHNDAYNEILKAISAPINQIRIWELSQSLTILKPLSSQKAIHEIDTNGLFVQEKSPTESIEVKPDSILIFIKLYSQELADSPMLYIGSMIVNANEKITTLISIVSQQLCLPKKDFFVYLEKDYSAKILSRNYSIKNYKIQNGSILIFQFVGTINSPKEIISKFQRPNKSKEVIRSYFDYIDVKAPFNINEYMLWLSNILRVELVDYDDLSKSYGKIEFLNDISMKDLVKFISFAFDVSKNEEVLLFAKSKE